MAWLPLSTFIQSYLPAHPVYSLSDNDVIPLLLSHHGWKHVRVTEHVDAYIQDACRLAKHDEYLAYVKATFKLPPASTNSNQSKDEEYHIDSFMDDCESKSVDSPSKLGTPYLRRYTPGVHIFTNQTALLAYIYR